MFNLIRFLSVLGLSALLFTSCAKKSQDILDTGVSSSERSASVSAPDLVQFSESQSRSGAPVYEVLPGPAVMNPAMNPTPFSDNIAMTTGSYQISIEDLDPDDSPNSRDQVKSVDIRFKGNDGREYKIDHIAIIHKQAGTGDHTFFGGVGRNKIMHGNTGIGTQLMPKMFAYITLWGTTDLKDATTDTIIAANRLIHLMVATRVRDDDLKMIASGDTDKSDHDFHRAETHIILPPQDLQGNMDPVPGTDHGFLHMMFENVILTGADREFDAAYEILPGPAVINPDLNPTPFSNKIALGSGSFSVETKDVTDEDATDSEDAVLSVNIRYTRDNGQTFVVDNIQVVHKEAGTGDHTFFGGVGYDKLMHGNTGIGTPLMPQLFSFITLWGVADLKDGDGNVLAAKRPVHIMVSSRVRTPDLSLINATDSDQSDHNQIEVHVIFPPQDTAGNPSPVPGTDYGFLHLMFEHANLIQ